MLICIGGGIRDSLIIIDKRDSNSVTIVYYTNLIIFTDNGKSIFIEVCRFVICCRDANLACLRLTQSEPTVFLKPYHIVVS